MWNNKIIRYITWLPIIILVSLNGQITFGWPPQTWWKWILDILSWMAVFIAIDFREYINMKARREEMTARQLLDYANRKGSLNG